jgi:hypothetical protein
MKYESLITYHSKDMANVKVFEKWVKLQGQGHKVKNFGLVIRNTHMKYESLQKIWPILKFLQTDGQAKNYMPPIFRYGGIKKLKYC